MSEIKYCPKRQKDFFQCPCHIEIFETMEPAPRNIRMKCTTHTFILDGSYCTVDEVIEAWNRGDDND